MTLSEVINHLRNNPIDAYYFIQGHFNMWYDQKYGLPWKKKRWILEKIQKAESKRGCLSNTECVACGCETPVMFYSDKPCKAPEYLNKEACY